MTTSLQDVALAVKRLQWRHHRAANTRLSTELGLSLPQWDVLRHLSWNPEASLHDLALMTFQTDQSMGALAARMIARNLLIRETGPGRVVRHRMTVVGQRARRRGAEIMDEVLAESLGGLSSSQLSTLHRLLSQAAGADATGA